MKRVLLPTLWGIVLIDVPVFIGIAVAGLVWGYEDVVVGYYRWREENPWTFFVSVAVLAAFVTWRVRRSRAASGPEPSP